MDTLRVKRLFLVALITSLCATAGLAIGTLLLGDFDHTASRILATTALLSAFSLVALPAGILMDQRRSLTLAWATVALAAFGFLHSQWVVWADDGENMWKLLGAISAFAVACAQTSSTTARRREGDPPTVGLLYLVSICTVFGLASLAVLALVEEIDDAGYYRFLGALAVLNILVALLQPVVRRLAASPLAEPPPRVDEVPANEETVYRFRCTLDRHPDALPPSNGYRPLPGETPAVECRVPARAFADALARAVRELEAGGAKVTAMSREGAG